MFSEAAETYSPKRLLLCQGPPLQMTKRTTPTFYQNQEGNMKTPCIRTSFICAPCLFPPPQFFGNEENSTHPAYGCATIILSMGLGLYPFSGPRLYPHFLKCRHFIMHLHRGFNDLHCQGGPGTLSETKP